MPDDYQPSPPNPSQAAPAAETSDSEEVVGEPAALMGSMWLPMLLLAVVVVVVLLVVMVLQSPRERAPTPATPPTSVEPQ